MTSKALLYCELAEQLRALLADERDTIANAANLAALIFNGLPSLNWAGFYFLKGDELVLGPFQGKVACTRIALGRGVCGTAAHTRQAVVVQNVHEFPGHIACDGASNSEIVVPIIHGDRVMGVLDLDSPMIDRFDEEDRTGLEVLARLFVASFEPGQ